jgi:hypothetical protein
VLDHNAAGFVHFPTDDADAAHARLWSQEAVPAVREALVAVTTGGVRVSE